MPEVTIEEMEELGTEEKPTPTAPDPREIKLEGGTTVAELLESNKRLQESLRISEDARQALRSSAGRVADPRETVVEDPADKITREQLEELFKTDPLKAMEVYEARFVKNLEGHLKRRFQPLVDGAAGSAEAGARTKYATEFELFGPQIKEVVEYAKTVDPSSLGQSTWWDDAIAYIRGKGENFEKLISHRAKKGKTEAVEAEVATSGFTPRRVAGNPSGPVDSLGLDEVQQQIARTQFPNLPPQKAYAEYKRWAVPEGQ